MTIVFVVGMLGKDSSEHLLLIESVVNYSYTNIPICTDAVLGGDASSM